MRKTINSDASCFIILEKIGHLDLLKKTYVTIFTTVAIAEEFGLPLPAWVIVRNPTNIDKQIELSRSIDAGEAGAIALAIELDDVTIVLDDQRPAE